MRRAKIRFTAAYVLSAFAFLADGAAIGKEYWVSAAGNDSAAGTENMPFATLERARDVDGEDLEFFAGQWLDTGGCSGTTCADMDGSTSVDCLDFAALAQNWGP